MLHRYITTVVAEWFGGADQWRIVGVPPTDCAAAIHGCYSFVYVRRDGVFVLCQIYNCRDDFAWLGTSCAVRRQAAGVLGEDSKLGSERARRYAHSLAMAKVPTLWLHSPGILVCERDSSVVLQDLPGKVVRVII